MKICKTAFSCLFVLLFCLLFQKIAAQDNWEPCQGVNINPIEEYTWHKLFEFQPGENRWYAVKYLSQEPSCHNKSDGYLKFLSVGIVNENNEIIHSFTSLKYGIQRFNSEGDYLEGIHNNQFLNVGKGKYIISIYSGTIRLDIEPVLHLGPYKTEPNIILYKSNNESCPGSEDGAFTIKVINLRAESEPHISWHPEAESDISMNQDGSILYSRMGLTAGTYSFTFSYKCGTQRCCAFKKVIINTNSCPEKLLVDPFTGEISSVYYINPPNSVTSNNGRANFELDGLLGIPYDLDILKAKALSVNFKFDGSGMVQVVDADINSLVSAEFSGFGTKKIILDENLVVHGYVDIHANAGSFVDDICITYFEDEIQSVHSLKPNSNNSSSRSNTVESYCIGDTIFPYDGFSVTGGITPYDFRWALDGDMVFDDADSLSHPIFFEETGNYNISLLVEDFVGQRDTVVFEYEVNKRDSVFLIVPDLNISITDYIVQTVCLDQTEFQIVPVPADASLSSTSLGLSGSLFNPEIAGLGEHTIVARGDDCDSDALLIVSVIGKSTSSFNTPPAYYTCSDEFPLNTLLTGDTTGVWILNDSIFLFTDTLPTSLLTVDEYKLTYRIGGDACIFESSVQFSVSESPLAILNNFNGSLVSSDPAIDLNLLVDPSSTLGGTWSGGAYITGDLFDPIGLIPGFYSITYTVGEGNCKGSDTIQIEVVSCNQNPVFSEIDTTICNGENFEGYNESGTHIDTLTAMNGCDSIIEIKLSVLEMNDPNCVGSFVSDIASENGMFIYPNPTASDLYFSFYKNGEYSYSIYAVNGLKTHEGKVIILEKNGRIDLSNFDTGIYFLELKNNSEQSTIAKFIKI